MELPVFVVNNATQKQLSLGICYHAAHGILLRGHDLCTEIAVRAVVVRKRSEEIVQPLRKLLRRQQQRSVLAVAAQRFHVHIYLCSTYCAVLPQPDDRCHIVRFVLLPFAGRVSQGLPLCLPAFRAGLGLRAGGVHPLMTAAAAAEPQYQRQAQQYRQDPCVPSHSILLFHFLGTYLHYSLYYDYSQYRNHILR